MTFEVSNLEISNDVKDLQLSNIELISVTFNSSKLDKFTDFKSLQFLNISLILLILLTSM